jgi:hypothetical protein
MAAHHALPRPAFRAAALLALLLAATGCKSGDTTSTGATSAASAAPAAASASSDDAKAQALVEKSLMGIPDAQTAAPPAPPSQLVVVARGSEPGRVLAYTFKAGQNKKFRIGMNATMSVLVNGQAMPAAPPQAYELTGTSSTKELRPDGSALRETVFGSIRPTMPGAPPEVLAQFQQQASMFQGLRMVETMTPQGKVTDVELDAAAMMNPQAQQLLQSVKDGMSNTLLPLPSEPVGVGAIWEDRRALDTSGIKLTQIGTFKLVSLEGSRALIEVTVRQTAQPSVVSDPRLPPGAKQEILSMNGEGTGTVRIDLARLDVESKMRMTNAIETKVSGLPNPMGAASGPGGSAPTASVRSTTNAKIDLDVSLKD